MPLKTVIFLILCLIVQPSWAESKVEPAPLVDPKATAETVALWQKLHAGRGKSLLFGHHETTRFHITPKPDGSTRWSDVRAVTGELPALWSFQINFALSPGGAERQREEIRYAHQLGAVICLVWHTSNPVTGGPVKDNKINIADILPDGVHHEKWMASMARAADFMASLTDSEERPIPFVFRPWHEHNLKHSFWWNDATQEEFNQLWQATVRYLRDTRGQHQILYAFNPNHFPPMGRGDAMANYLALYPGDAWVDILGIDYYGNLEGSGIAEILRAIVRVANARGKLPVFTEGGPSLKGVGARNADPEWYAQLLRLLRDDPELRTLAWFMTWYNKPETFWVPHAPSVPGHAAFLTFHADPFTRFLPAPP